MPEGHSIRRLSLAFQESFVGRECRMESPQGRFAAGAALLDGQTMVAAESYGKHLFLGFSPGPANEPENNLWLHVHLGIYGAWLFQGEVPPTSLVSRDGRAGSIGAPRKTEPSEYGSGIWRIPEPRGAVRVRILVENCVADLTGPTRCEVAENQDKMATEQRLGPDPLRNSLAARRDFISRIRGSRRSVGELVMDQAMIAGVGNIYRAECLFRQGISPFRSGSAVSVRRLGLLWDDFVSLLQIGVTAGSILTLKSEDKCSTTDQGPDRWYVYHREGQPCLRCGRKIRTTKMQGRQLFWCATCQR